MGPMPISVNLYPLLLLDSSSFACDKRMTNTIVAEFELHLCILEREKSGTAVCKSSGLSSYGARGSALDWGYKIRSFLLHQQAGQDALFSPDLCRRGGRVVGSSRAQTPHT